LVINPLRSVHYLTLVFHVLLTVKKSMPPLIETFLHSAHKLQDEKEIAVFLSAKYTLSHSTHKLPLEEKIVVQDIRWPCTFAKKTKTCRTGEILVLCTPGWRFPGVGLWAPWRNKQKCSSFLNLLISSPNWANLVIYKLYVGDFYAI